jgi:hypothetical protein
MGIGGAMTDARRFINGLKVECPHTDVRSVSSESFFDPTSDLSTLFIKTMEICTECGLTLRINRVLEIYYRGRAFTMGYHRDFF